MPTAPVQQAREIIEAARAKGSTNLLETEGRALFEAYEIALPRAVLAEDRERAVECALDMDCPIAMKIVCADALHKSDVGGVLLNLEGREQVALGFDTIIDNVTKACRPADITGILVSPMVPKGVECIIGMVRDLQFGPVLMFGLGGIFVEVLRDVSFRVIPPTLQDIDDMIREIRGYPVLTGARGEPPKDIDALRNIVTKLDRMAVENPEIQEIDLNPVIVHERGASIVDVRVIIQ
jgi:acyl-CoA synthetase (NDP forming)